ncbi:B3 domain-containing protein Os01g0905400-like isoform X2 [Phragmites australis]|uniref:B3 domain-containing protein Os01g0905400-like isoform X2 n=1 Tax=Phragmites australis TaxID=29695 RepID=UPI002D79B0C3|nr:B3 domain-containing protein Os01g0905400-like isoform X2 [Phragmites australis]
MSEHGAGGLCEIGSDQKRRWFSCCYTTKMMEVTGGALKKEQEESVVDIDSGEEEAENVVKRRRRRKKACDPHRKRACVDCTKMCSQIHGRATWSSSGRSSSKARPIPAVPSFFKVMMGYFSENMDIPPPFAKTILDLSGSNIYLEDAFGLRWRVRLCLRDGVLSFGHGWKNFVLDHAVSCGEFLVFRQIARSVFTVQMFAPSAVERLYPCERNKRQSRKRKPREETSSLSIQTVKKNKNNVESCKKKQRIDLRNDLGPSDCKMSVLVCVDDSDVPNSASELKCSETSVKAPEVGAAESQEVSEVSLRHQGIVQKVFDGETETADDCTIFKEKEKECNATVRVHPTSVATGQQPPESIVVAGLSVTPNTNNTTNMMMDGNESTHADQNRPFQLHRALALEIENGEGSNLPTNVDASEPLAMMDLNEVSMHDIFLSADIYEFESDLCNPEAFSVDLNMEGPNTNGQTSGFSCPENNSNNRHSSIGVGQHLMMLETLSCTENKEMTDTPGTCTGAVNVPAHGIDINALPSNEPSSFGENCSPPTDAEVPSSECALTRCNKEKCNILFNQAAQKKDKPQDDQVNMQDSTGQNAAEIMSSRSKPLQTVNNSGGLQSRSFESGGVLALEANSGKFCIAVPTPDQTWLELPGRLPALPRTKKQGRKVVVLKDPCMRLWPVLYQCTPRFNGFISGWVDISRENNLQEGDTCEFELSGHSELSFQLRMPNAQ